MFTNTVFYFPTVVVNKQFESCFYMKYSCYESNTISNNLTAYAVKNI